MCGFESYFGSEKFDVIVACLTKQYGPPHHVESPTFTTSGDIIRQNKIVSWDTDTGVFRVSKYDLSRPQADNVIADARLEDPDPDAIIGAGRGIIPAVVSGWGEGSIRLVP